VARFSVAARAAGAGSTLLPSGSLYSPAGSGGRLREVGVFNTTATAVAIKLARLTTAGTQGATLTEVEHDEVGPPPLMTAFNTHTAGPTIAGDLYQASLGAAIGAGVIWTFGDSGIVIPVAVTNGVGIVTATGTGQILDFYFVWDE